ncbi:unnamed protein product [Ixodes hexagonus]
MVLTERGSTDKILLKIHDNLVLTLEKSSVFSKISQSITRGENSNITHNMHASDIERNLYHDAERGAALMVNDDDGLRVEGTLGDTLRIRPSSVDERNSDGKLAHKIFEITPRQQGGKKGTSLRPFLTKHKNSNPICTSFLVVEINIPVRVSPEVHVVIDKAHSDRFQSRGELMEYLAIFIAAVNLKFTTLLYVDLQLVVTKITFTVSARWEPFILRSASHPTIMLGQTVGKFSIYVGQTDDFRGDDMVVLLTGMDIGYVNETTGRPYGQGISGLANLRGACGLWTKGALVEDLARTYEGVHGFAHECGHLQLLNCTHEEGSPPPANLKNALGAQRCPAEERHIMSPSINTRSNFRFSYCSAAQLYAFLG